MFGFLQNKKLEFRIDKKYIMYFPDGKDYTQEFLSFITK